MAQLSYGIFIVKLRGNLECSSAQPSPAIMITSGRTHIGPKKWLFIINWKGFFLAFKVWQESMLRKIVVLGKTKHLYYGRNLRPGNEILDILLSGKFQKQNKCSFN
jgi:hypothetical protein